MIDRSRDAGLSPSFAAPQHKPRPLTLFLELLRSETAASPDRRRRALAGLRRYQEASRPPASPPRPALAEVRGAALRDHGGDGPTIVLVPSLINPPTVLDMGPDRSLAAWLAARGRRVLLVDWGGDVAARGGLNVAGHVEDILVPLVAGLGARPALVGYCLGGTMALGAAARMPLAGIATIAAPWHFDGYGAAARQRLGALWGQAAPHAERLGLLPMEVLQTAFWALDPARSVAKFEAFADRPPSAGADAFVALEDWANDGPPLPLPAARELFDGFYRDDAPGTGRWLADPSACPAPMLHIASTTDRIVPSESAPRVGERIDLALGHVGMMVGSRARQALWEPLEAWLSRLPPS